MPNLWITHLHRGRVGGYNDNNDMEYIRTSKIIKTGTSLCVVLPKTILAALQMQRGDQIVFGIYNSNSLVIRKITREELNIWTTPKK